MTDYSLFFIHSLQGRPAQWRVMQHLLPQKSRTAGQTISRIQGRTDQGVIRGTRPLLQCSSTLTSSLEALCFSAPRNGLRYVTSQ
jgi:hypothetical protein